MLKVGGVYQKALYRRRLSLLVGFLETALQARTLQTLSASEFNRIFDGGRFHAFTAIRLYKRESQFMYCCLLADDSGVWVLVAIPHQGSWDHISDVFIEASIRLAQDNIQVSY